MEKKIAHLEFIQTVIERMARCSFLLKGWAVTLVSAIFALAAKDANTNFVIVAIIPVVAFWVLDGFYLNQERLYRALYVDVANAKEEDIDFSLDVSKYAGTCCKSTWFDGIFSKTNGVFYGMLIAVLIIVIYFVIPAIGNRIG